MRTRRKTTSACRAGIVRQASAAAAIAVAAFSVGRRAHAASDSLATSNNTGSNAFGALNWTASATPGAPAVNLSTGAAIFFTSTSSQTFTTLNDNYAAGFQLSGITYGTGTAAYIIGGNSFNLSGGITNSSTNLETISDNIVMVANNTITTTASGGNVALSGVISGAFSITDAGSPLGSTSTLTLSGVSSTYSGGTLIGNSGSGSDAIVIAAATQALGTGTITLETQGNSTQAKLELTGGISLNNAVAFTARGSGNNTPGIENISGNNVMSGLLTAGTGGNTYIIQSDAGTLNMSNGTFAIPSNKFLGLQGAGNGIMVASMTGGTAGGSSLIKAGAGTWALTGANAYLGVTNISAGTLVLGNGGTTGSLATTSVITDNGIIGFNRSNAVSQGTDFATVISGSGGLLQTGSSTLTISGVNTYTGATNIASGTLVLTGTINSSSGAVTVNAGGTLAGPTVGNGTGTIIGALNVVGGTSAATQGTVNLINSGLVGTLATGALTVGGTTGNYSQLSFDAGDKINAGSNVFTVNAGGAYITVSPTGIAANQALTLITYGSITGAGFTATGISPSGGSTSSIDGLTLTDANISFGVTGVLNVSNGSVILNTSGFTAPAVAYWKGNQGTTWAANDGTNGNFTTDIQGTMPVGAYPSSTTNVVFSAAGATNLTNTLGQDFSIASLTFNGDSANGSTGMATIGGTNTLTIGAGGINMQTSNGGAVLQMATLAVGAPQTWENDSTSDLNILANVSGGSALTINSTNTGKIVLGGTSTFTGGTTLIGGLLQLNGSNTALGAVSNALTINAGVLNLNNTIPSIGSLNGTGGKILNNGVGAVAVTLTIGTAGGSNGTGSYSGVIADNDGTGGTGTVLVTKTGSGTLVLSGVNTYSGATSVSQGILSISTIGTASGIASNIGESNIINLGSSAGLGTLVYTGVGETTSKIVTLASGFPNGGVIDQSGTGTLTFTSNLAVPTSPVKTFFLQGSNLGGTGVFAGNITNGTSATISLTKAGTGTWTVSGTNTYTGPTNVSGGTLISTGSINEGTTSGIQVGTVASTNAILTESGAVTATTLGVGNATGANGAVFQTNGTVVYNSGAGTGDFQLGAVASGFGYYALSGGTLTANEYGIGGSFAATTGVIDVSGGTMTSNGYITIARGSTTSSGVLNVTGGTVNATRFDIDWGSSTGSTSVLNVGNISGGTVTAAVNTTGSASVGLNLNDTNVAGSQGIVNLLPNGTLTTGIIYAGSSAVPTTLVNFNGGTLKATATNAGTTFLTAANITGVYVYGNGGTIDNNSTAITVGKALLSPGGNGVASVSSSSSFYGTGYTGAPLVSITSTSGVGATGYATIDGSGDVTGIVITNPGTNYTASTTTVTLVGGGGTPSTFTTNLNTLGNAGGGMTFNGSGTTTLTNTSTYTGATTINTGTLQLGNNVAGSDGALSGTSGITDNGTLAYNNSGAQTVGYVIGGTGGKLIKAGAGTLTLTNTDTYGGITTITGAGNLQLGNGSSGSDGSLSATSSVVDNATLTYNLFGNQTPGYNISGTGAVAKTGAGTLTLSGTNSYTGSTTITNGSVIVSGIINSPAATLYDGYLTSTSNLSVTGTGVVTVGNLWVAEGIGGVSTSTGSVASGGIINTVDSFVVGRSGTVSPTLSTFTVNGTLNVNTVTGNQTSAPTVNLEVATYDKASGTLTINPGGAVNVENNALLVIGAQSTSGNGIVNQEGGAITFYSDSAITAGGTGYLAVGSAATPTGTYTYNLDGGTLTAPYINKDGTSGTGIFNFNGGTVVATGTLATSTDNPNASFIYGLSTANVRIGGAIINTNGFNVTVPQPLLHSTIGGDPSTDGGLNKIGAGTLTLTGASTYTGPTNISSGTLQLGNGTLDGTISTSSNILLLNNGALIYARATTASPFTYSNPITGTGSVTKTGAGTQILSGNNSYSNGTTISGGVLEANNPTSSLGGGMTTITGGVLAGTGNTGGPVTVNGGIITAGNNATSTGTPGTLHTQAQTWTSGSFVDKVGSVVNDTLVMSSLTGVTSGFTVQLQDVSGGASTPFTTTGSYIVLADNQDTSSGNQFASQASINALNLNFQAGTFTPAVSGDSIVLDSLADGSNGYDLVAEEETAPEPTSMILLGVVTAPLMLGRRRRRLMADVTGAV